MNFRGKFSKVFFSKSQKQTRKGDNWRDNKLRVRRSLREDKKNCGKLFSWENKRVDKGADFPTRKWNWRIRIQENESTLDLRIEKKKKQLQWREVRKMIKTWRRRKVTCFMYLLQIDGSLPPCALLLYLTNTHYIYTYEFKYFI